MQSLLIKDTTRAQREEIVRRALSACGGSCEGCNGCGNSGGGRVEAIYQPYIDGEKELAQINEEYAAFFGAHKPGRVIVSTTTLHFGCLVEIEAVAEMPEGR